MWPYWVMKEEPEAGVYKVLMFAGYNNDPNDKKHEPIVILRSLNGYLNEAVPMSGISKFFDQAKKPKEE